MRFLSGVFVGSLLCFGVGIAALYRGLTWRLDG